jgi:alpha-L-rhamnosidase
VTMCGMRWTSLTCVGGSLVILSCVCAAQIAPELLAEHWSAQWIACPDAPQRDPGVFHFRKSIDLAAVPAHFVVHVSADNRFILHVNGRWAGEGPARSDLAHWRFETVDLAPFLRAGPNLIAATVWNFGAYAAVAQMSSRAAFLMQGDSKAEQVVNTDASWQAEQERGVEALPLNMISYLHNYYAAEQPERLDARAYDWNWDAKPTGQLEWKAAVAIGAAAPFGAQDSPTIWALMPDPLPPMERSQADPGKVVRSNGIDNAAQFPGGAVVVPPNTSATLLLDAGELTTAFPELAVRGGAGATIRLTYAEALVDEKREKGKRNEIAGKHIEGVFDEFIADGNAHTFAPLVWRTWRYLQIDVANKDQPLTLESLHAWFSAYPLQQHARFDSDVPELARIFNIGWHTARLDAHETYMDTPYWEQLQYVGDTRIQALISYAVSGDDRLARQAIDAIDASRIPEGVTQSRYPSALPQFIPTFSLLWIGMVHDLWLYRNDAAFVRGKLEGTRTVLDWFVAHQRRDGMLGRLPWWNFVDWTEGFESGVPPQDRNGGSAAITLQFVEALGYAAELENALGDRNRAAAYADVRKRAADAVLRQCWNAAAGLIADTPAQKTYSQQANILAVWLDVLPASKQKEVMARVLAASGEGASAKITAPHMALASYYFRFYFARALLKAGMADEYLQLLGPWRQMLKLGLTTWAETPEPTRSDSHAWSAHPTYDLLTIVAGIRPKAPGFAQVTIEPHLGTLKRVRAAMPYGSSEITADYDVSESGVAARLSLPAGLSGELVWKGKSYALAAGAQTVRLPAR